MLRDWAGGFVLGAAITLLVFVHKSLLSADLISFGIGVCFGVFTLLFLLYYFQLIVTGQGQGQTGMCIEKCTCQDQLQTSCMLCDPRKLMKLARNIPDDCLMTQLGLELGVNANVIETCKNDNKRITQAVYDMLYNKWYKSLLIQEDSEYDWKSELKKALVNIGQGNLIRTIVER